MPHSTSKRGKKEQRRNCGKSTKYMFSMNEGVYCDKCKEYGFAIQQFNCNTERFKEQMKMYRESWSRPLIIRVDAKNA